MHEEVDDSTVSSILSGLETRFLGLNIRHNVVSSLVTVSPSQLSVHGFLGLTSTKQWVNATCSRPQQTVPQPGLEPGTPWSLVRNANHCLKKFVQKNIYIYIFRRFTVFLNFTITAFNSVSYFTYLILNMCRTLKLKKYFWQIYRVLNVLTTPHTKWYICAYFVKSTVFSGYPSNSLHIYNTGVLQMCMKFDAVVIFLTTYLMNAYIKC